MLDVALAVCGVAAAITTLYGLYFIVMAAPLRRHRAPAQPTSSTVHKFAVLVFAKNEAPVIGQLLETLRAQRYPADAFDIFVVADNCTDETAAIARAGGATVWERFDPDNVGKGKVVGWFFERFRTEGADRYDACAVFDADNIVDPGFLEVMNRQLNAGYDVSVGIRRSKNASSSAIAGAAAVFWLFQAWFLHGARMRHGLSCLTVGGTGFVFRLAVLPDGRWLTRSVCEDIEFTLRAIADGFSVSITYDAVFYDEQPLTWAQSVQQRYRWTLGALEMLKYSTPVVWRAFRQGRRKTFDALIYSLGGAMPGLSVIVSALLTVLVGVSTGQWALIGLSTLVGACVGYLAVAVVAWGSLAFGRAWWDGAWKAIALFPVFMFTWTLIGVVVLFYRNTTWVPMPHTEALTLDDVQQAAKSKRVQG